MNRKLISGKHISFSYSASTAASFCDVYNVVTCFSKVMCVIQGKLLGSTIYVASMFLKQM